jgi:conjugal transfer/type IV secretion protein DotA/TraY
MKVTPKRFFGYALMPRIIPLARSLLSSGFAHVAFYMAQIYGAARLLPQNHAYLNPQNMGRFGISHVILESARNLRFTRNHIDQITIFILMLAGIGLLFAQMCLLGFAVFVQTAHAGMPTTWSGFFVTPTPVNDIAHILMDRVFGIPGFFNSCVDQGVPCINNTAVVDGTLPFPYHTALQGMLAFYSVGLCAIGLIIFLYYIVAIAVETAQTGTPFGKRYNHVWAPIRMVVALALLIPLSYGLNGAQLLTLHIAKWGSAFATNGWTLFSDVLITSTVTLAGSDPSQMVAEPQKPKPNELFRFYTVLATCAQAYEKLGISIDAYLVRPVQVPLIHNTLMETQTWQQAIDWYEKGAILVVFGEDGHPDYTGDVKPYCGEITLEATDQTEPGSVAMQSGYYEQFIQAPWDNIKNGTVLQAAANLPAPSNAQQDFFDHAAQNIIDFSLMPNTGNALLPDIAAQNAIMAWWDGRITVIIANGIAAQVASPEWLGGLPGLGWAGAGIWYNKIAQMNGAIAAAVSNLPAVKTWPLVMQDVAEAKAKGDKSNLAENLYQPYLSGGKPVQLKQPEDFPLARTFYEAYRVWESTSMSEMTGTGPTNIHPSKNSFIDYVNMVFGTQGLYSMRYNDGNNIHPLAQIVVMGKNLFDTAIRNLAWGVGGSFASFIAPGDGPPLIFKALGSFATTLGLMTLSMGFVMYYVIPFLPFIYFFFQVGGWIKALFEAMVGLPLWALAHIRIDGEGLPGDAAVSGYFLIFEIFLRPILTIFGFVGGISIFAAQVEILNQIFDLVVSNVTGFDHEAAKGFATGVGAFAYARGGIDQLFHTVVYAIIVYMMAIASFKLVYLVPDNILRWMGSGVDGFGELAKDAPEHLPSQIYGGSAVATQQISGAASSLLRIGRR